MICQGHVQMPTSVTLCTNQIFPFATIPTGKSFLHGKVSGRCSGKTQKPKIHKSSAKIFKRTNKDQQQHCNTLNSQLNPQSSQIDLPHFHPLVINFNKNEVKTQIVIKLLPVVLSSTLGVQCNKQYVLQNFTSLLVEKAFCETLAFKIVSKREACFYFRVAHKR